MMNITLSKNLFFPPRASKVSKLFLAHTPASLICSSCFIFEHKTNLEKRTAMNEEKHYFLIVSCKSKPCSSRQELWQGFILWLHLCPSE